jgi:pimeloyl-ACP methyl ester carboxylesterase
MEQYPDLDTKNIDVKTLIMYGEKSPDFMGETAKQLCEAMPHAQLRSLEGQIHDVKANVLAPILAEFFVSTS